MNTIAFANDDQFVEMSDENIDDVSGGVATAIGVFLAAAAFGYMMGADWARQDQR